LDLHYLLVNIKSVATLYLNTSLFCVGIFVLINQCTVLTVSSKEVLVLYQN